MRYGSSTITRILAGQGHYPDYLFRAEGGRRSGAGLVGEHLFDHLREEYTITTTFVVVVVVVVVVCCCFLPHFLLGGY